MGDTNINMKYKASNQQAKSMRKKGTQLHTLRCKEIRMYTMSLIKPEGQKQVKDSDVESSFSV